MLGEAALTAHDAERYLQSYETAIHAIGPRRPAAASSKGRHLDQAVGRCTRATAARSTSA
jgi:proline dehydrogenase